MHIAHLYIWHTDIITCVQCNYIARRMVRCVGNQRTTAMHHLQRCDKKCTVSVINVRPRMNDDVYEIVRL